jgi:hypothetical protein
MIAPVRAICLTLRVANGMRAAIACDAISKSISAMTRPWTSSDALSLPHTAAVDWSGCKMRSPHQMWIASNHVSRRWRWAGSIALAMPYSISDRTIVDRKHGWRFSAMKSKTRLSGLDLASSLQTLVSISTKNLAVFSEIGARGKFKPHAARRLNKIFEKFGTAHRSNAGSVIPVWHHSSLASQGDWLVPKAHFYLADSRRRGGFIQRGIDHHLSQMILHRTAVRRRDLAEAQFGVFGDVSNRQTCQNVVSNSIAMQSMYAMKAMLSNA